VTLLAKAAILAAADLKHEDVEVPEWGGTVRVRMMSGAERDAFESSFATAEMFAEFRVKGPAALQQNMRGRLVSFTAVGEDGERLFTDEDAVALGKKSVAALDRVVAVAMRLNALSQGDLDQLGKLYGAMFGGASTSSSPDTSAAP
jgi:hypothetical protein